MVGIKVHVHTVAGLKCFVTLGASMDEARNVNLCMSSRISRAFAHSVTRDTSPVLFPLLYKQLDFLFQVLVFLPKTTETLLSLKSFPPIISSSSILFSSSVKFKSNSSSSQICLFWT